MRVDIHTRNQRQADRLIWWSRAAFYAVIGFPVAWVCWLVWEALNIAISQGYGGFTP